VVILAGNTTATVTLDPTADSTAEPDETGILTVTAGTGYSIGTPAGATGTITNDDDSNVLVDVRVIPVAAPSTEGSTSLPREISSTAIGSTYYVEIWIQEHSTDFNGIAGGQVDFRYTTGNIDALAVVNKDFDVLTRGTIDDPNGLVNDLGGGTLGSGRGNQPAWARLAYVQVSATAPGEATFSLAQGGLQFSLVAGGNVAWTSVDLSDTAVVTHGGAGSQLDLRVVRSETLTDAQGEIAVLPADEVWLDEWEAFWVEVWASTPNSASVGITGGTLDLNYNTAVMTATRIEYGPSFDQFQTGTLDDVAGIVDNLGAGTLRTNVGDDAFVLLARVRFEPSASDQVVVDEVNHSIGPAALNLSLSNATVALVGVGNTTPQLPPSPATEMFAVVYDIDDNDSVDFGDFSFFATAFGQTVGGTEPPYTWWADYDKSGTVDLGDFSFFTPAFGKGKPSGEIQFPANYPDAWRPAGAHAESVDFTVDTTQADATGLDRGGIFTTLMTASYYEAAGLGHVEVPPTNSLQFTDTIDRGTFLFSLTGKGHVDWSNIDLDTLTLNTTDLVSLDNDDAAISTTEISSHFIGQERDNDVHFSDAGVWTEVTAWTFAG
jgi:hypothetical protein